MIPEKAQQQHIRQRALRLDSVAKALDISTRTLSRWVATGEFPAPDFRHGSKLVFWRAETVDAWVDQHFTGGAGGVG